MPICHHGVSDLWKKMVLECADGSPT